MKKPTYNKSDRLPVRKNNPHTPEARERVIDRLRASAKADFVFIVRWLTTGKSNGEPIPLNRPGFPGECFICELRLPDHRFRWKHNKLFLLLPEEYGPAFPA
ncbi:hypothetical protein ACUOID_23720, partial [Escherichia coli]